MRLNKGYTLVLLLLITALSTILAVAQETTGGLQGTVKDTSGAVIPAAEVTVSGASLIGNKVAKSDSAGYFHFANLPPGAYTVEVTAKGFSTLKREGIVIEVGHLPSLDLALQVGGSEQVVEVVENAAPIDVTTTRTITNITQDVITNAPKGRSFQSVIQYAPSARNEPLAGRGTSPYTGTGGGGSSPGNNTNGQPVGYSVAGGADSENSYLVEGQETANIVGGYSNSNVPFEFIDEVQIKSSGVEAEHGGSLGGVVNVIVKKGNNAIHGQAFTYFESNNLDGSQSAFLQYDPSSSVFIDPQNPQIRRDSVAQLYQPKRDNFKIVQPGFEIGGPLVKDRVFFFLGFAPQYNSTVRQVNFGGSDGVQTFNQDQQTYFGTTNVDVAVTKKIRVSASWLTQYQRESGARLPLPDSIQGFQNTSTLSPVTNFTHGIGFSAPASTYAVHADITLSPTLIATTRFGYSFQNYHDFGYPTSGNRILFSNSGIYTVDPQTGQPNGATDANGNPLPDSLQQAEGTTNLAYSPFFTFKNVNKHQQFDQDIAWFKSGWLGTHNFKFGYQLNHLATDIVQLGNVPNVQLSPGQSYNPVSQVGLDNCGSSCQGLYGYLLVNDFGTAGQASNFNHGLFAQDAWTIGKGLTLNLGIRVDKEYLPAFANAGLSARPINFGWSDKVAPRLGASWDVFRNGKMKVFGSYGVFNDVMKLNLAVSSFGGQFWRQCIYTLDPNATDSSGNPTFDPNNINAAFVNGRACPSGPATAEANFAGGTTPAGLRFIENIDNRGTTGVAPGVKPYRQHEAVFGVDYQLAKTWTLEARWDRRRLDHVIEDTAIFDAANGVEKFTNVNPGQGVNSTFNGFSNFLYGNGGPTCDPAVCKIFPASRSYDGVEIRLNKTGNSRYSGMFSYTYSRLRGNYTGLTSTDEVDGFGGRNAPNNSRGFDEPYFQYTAHGTSSAGPLPTDRPNTFKGYAYYRIPEGSRNNTTLGLFQTAYEGTPQSTFLDVGFASTGSPIFPVFVEGRGKWADVSVDPTTGNITVNSVTSKRTPWYTQSDVSIAHEIKVNKNNEHQVLGFEANITNLFNQRAVTAYWDGLNSLNNNRPLAPNGLRIVNEGQYQAYMSPYDWPTIFNNNVINQAGGPPLPRAVVANSWYGMPFLFQQSRTVRFKVKFDF